MPAEVNKPNRAQYRMAMMAAACLLLISLTAAMFYDLSRRRSEAEMRLREVEQKELQAQSLSPISERELAQWTDQERQIASLLIPDQEAPVFLEEITNLGERNRIQPGITSEDKAIDAANATAEELKLLAIGVQRYMIMTITFRSEYPDAARFLSAIAELPRAVEFKTVSMRRSPPLVDVTMTLHVYKREGA